jgi:AraC-like DNA-binding protein
MRGLVMICKKPKTRATHEVSIQIVLDYIERNLSHLDVECLHEMTVLSRFHFHRVFTEIMGETPGQFVRRKRLEAAMRLLKSGENDLNILAACACYSSLSAFSRAFRDQFGITPGTLAYQLKRDQARARIIPAVMMISDCSATARFRFLSATLPSKPTTL